VLVNFSALVTSVSDPRTLLPPTLTPGTSLTGTLSYASDASCDRVLPTTCEYIASPSSLALWTGTTPIASVAGRAYLFVADGPLVDSFSASVGAPAAPSGGSDPDWLSGDVQLSDPGATALGSTGLPATLTLSDFSQHTFDAGGCYGGACTGNPSDQFQIVGTILGVQPAPEPEGATLGLLVLEGSKSRRARRSRRLACSRTTV